MRPLNLTPAERAQAWVVDYSVNRFQVYWADDIAMNSPFSQIWGADRLNEYLTFHGFVNARFTRMAREKRVAEVGPAFDRQPRLCPV